MLERRPEVLPALPVVSRPGRAEAAARPALRALVGVRQPPLKGLEPPPESRVPMAESPARWGEGG